MKMRRLSIFLMFIAVLASALAQSESGNIYVYRNDGRFNAFFSSEVDSMSYSNTGPNGRHYDHPVVQRIHTADSTYCIPLAVIDSISVQTPRTKYAPGVKRLNPDYVPYILGSEGLRITFSTELPYNMTINKGDILLYDRFDDEFPTGFAGRVVSIVNSGGLQVDCEAVGLSDIYEQFVGFGEAEIASRAPEITGALPRAAASAGVQCEISIDPIIRVAACIQNGNTIIETTIGALCSYDANIRLGGSAEGRRVLASGKIPVGQPIPALMTVDVGFENFIEYALSASAGIGFSGDVRLSRTIVYDNGNWNLGTNRITAGRPNLDVDISGGFSISCGAGLTVGLSLIGDIGHINISPSLGRSLEVEVSKDFSSFDKFSLYDVLKEATCTSSSFAELTMRAKLLNREFSIPLTGRFKYNIDKTYLLPEFSELDVKTDDGSMTVTTTASRRLAVPCKVGLAVLDEDGEEVDSYYEDESIYLHDVALNKTFSRGLDAGKKYAIRPVVKLFNLNMYARPDEEAYLDCSLTTGKASATTYSVRTSGYFDEKPADGTEVGFVYSGSCAAPTVDNASRVKGTLADQSIDGGFSGLTAGTTYYYRAYARYNDKYYYGNTQCVTTKKNCDRSDAENTGGDYVKGYQPMADVGQAFDVDQETAKIELSFRYVHPSAECSYHLEGDDKNGNRVASQQISLGTVTGLHTIELSDLIPGTTYRFWGDLKSAYGSDVSPIGSFETKPSPDPNGVVVDITDVKMETARVTCKFDNIKEDFECGIILSDGNWEYCKRMEPNGSGMATLDLSELLAETEYSVKTYVVTSYDPEPIEGKTARKFTTEGPDLTGWWVLHTNGEVYLHPGPFDVNFLETGKTNYFWGLNFLHWEREGRELYMHTPDYATQVGTSAPTTVWEFFGRFNEEYTVCTGQVQLRNFRLDEVLATPEKPFRLVRKVE